LIGSAGEISSEKNDSGKFYLSGEGGHVTFRDKSKRGQQKRKEERGEREKEGGEGKERGGE
jgi:hypothetical protein